MATTLEKLSHDVLDIVNDYEKLPFGKFPEEIALREKLVITLDTLAWQISPETCPCGRRPAHDLDEGRCPLDNVQ